jgi:hypothetical protein
VRVAKSKLSNRKYKVVLKYRIKGFRKTEPISLKMFGVWSACSFHLFIFKLFCSVFLQYNALSFKIIQEIAISYFTRQQTAYFMCLTKSVQFKFAQN